MKLTTLGEIDEKNLDKTLFDKVGKVQTEIESAKTVEEASRKAFFLVGDLLGIIFKLCETEG